MEKPLCEKVIFTMHYVPEDKACENKSSRATCRMAYLPAEVTRSMLSYSIAMTEAITTAIMKMASSTTTTSTFIENTSDIVTIRATTSRTGGSKNNDIQ